MKPYYECHITMLGHTPELEKLVKGFGWLYSKIDGDPNLGAGVKCYATIQLNVGQYTQDQVISILEEIAERLAKEGAKVLRTKVELVVYDNRRR